MSASTSFRERAPPWARALALLSLATLLTYGLVLSLLKVPFALLLAGFAAVLEVIPVLGPLVAAAAMWEGQEWGGYLLAATVALLLPFDLRQAVASPTPGHILLAATNAAALVVLVLLVRGWPPVRHS